MYFYGRDTRPPLVQRIVPNGETGLCFYRGDKVSYGGVGEVGSCFAAQTMHYTDIKAHGGIEIVGAHFTVLGARMFLPAPLSEYTNQVLSVGDVGLGELERQVMDAVTADECWVAMDHYFLHSLMRNGYYDLSHFSSDFRKISGYSPSRLLEVSENDGDEVGWRI